MARGAGAALHREPHRLVEHQHVVVLVEHDRLQEFAGLLLGFGEHRRSLAASSFSGGMRTAAPSSSRSLASTRLPLTRNSPLRISALDMGELSPGNFASRKRSTRMPFSSAVTATVWTLVDAGADRCRTMTGGAIAAAVGGGRSRGGSPSDFSTSRRSQLFAAFLARTEGRGLREAPPAGDGRDFPAGAVVAPGFAGARCAAGRAPARTRAPARGAPVWRGPAVCRPPPGCLGPPLCFNLGSCARTNSRVSPPALGRSRAATAAAATRQAMPPRFNTDNQWF